jgi:soluble cytochrome b562
MKISLSRFATSLLIPATLAISLSARADEDGPKSPLAQQMDGISKDFRALRKVVGDPAQKDAALKLVKDMEDHATKAKGFEPAKTKDIAPGDKDQFIADYKKQMDGLIGDFQKLEEEVSDGKTADATAMLDTIQSDKRQGHKKFNAEDSHGPGGPAPAKPAQSGTAG